jgi:hypothetical protein
MIEVTMLRVAFRSFRVLLALLTCTDSRVASVLFMENDIHSLLCFQRVEYFDHTGLRLADGRLAGGQGHELHPIAPTGAGNPTEYAARMMNDAAHSIEDQKPQALGPRGKILFRERHALERRHDIVREHSQASPSRVGAEAPARQHPSRQLIFQHVVNRFDGACVLPMSLQKAFRLPMPHIGDHGEVLMLGTVGKQLPLFFPDPDRHPTQRPELFLFLRFGPVVQHIRTFALRVALVPVRFPSIIVNGQRDPLELAKLRNPRIKASEETVSKSLQGNWRLEHLFTLKQSRQM